MAISVGRRYRTLSISLEPLFHVLQRRLKRAIEPKLSDCWISAHRPPGHRYCAVVANKELASRRRMAKRATMSNGRLLARRQASKQTWDWRRKREKRVGAEKMEERTSVGRERK